MKSVLAFILALSLLTAITPSAATAPKVGFEYYVTGDAADVASLTSAGTLLMGGGLDVDQAFQWMISKSGGGDFVVIRATGTEAYNPYIFGLGSVNSVETLIIKSRTAASDPFVLDKINKAEALFIAGGDQNDYVTFWKGTPVEDAIHSLIARNVPIGGTSAGLAILGEFTFTASNGTVDSITALRNPFNRRIALDHDFLAVPDMGGIITDSHFVNRDRMGRLVTFLARILNDGWAAQARGIGIDENTALAVEADGNVTLLGTGSAYFLQTPGLPETCLNKTDLIYRNISVQRMSGAATFNLRTWTGNGLTSYFLSAENGSLTSTQAGGEIY